MTLPTLLETATPRPWEVANAHMVSGADGVILSNFEYGPREPAATGIVDAANARLAALAVNHFEEMYRMLKRLEFPDRISVDDTDPECACCNWNKSDGHDRGCPLASLLTRLEEAAG